MTIEKVEPGDMGNYTCTVTNDVGKDAVTAALLVEDAPQIQPFAFPKDPRASSKIVISCNAHVGTEPISFAWFKNGERVRTGTKVQTKVLGETVSILTLLEVSAEDVGNYTCQAGNRFGTDSITAELVLTAEPPKIQPFTFPTNLLRARKVIVYCAVLEGSEPLTFVWTKDGRELANGGRLHIKQLSETGSSLTIATVGAEDIGNYTCTVSNVAGSDSATSQLLVKDAPRLQPFYFPREHPPGESVVVTCVASRGSQPMKFAWLKNGVDLKLGSNKATPKMFTESVSALTIPNVSAEDVANYTCRATNAAGSDSYTAELIVTEGPKIQPFSFPNDAQLGKDAAVSCFAVRGHQPLKFSWLKNGVRADGIANVEVEEIAGKISTLTLRKVSAADIGNYTCHVSNVAGTDEFTTSLVVNEAPQIQPFAFPKQPRANSKIVISCNAHVGAEPISFDWLKDGRRVISGTKVQTKAFSETVSILTLLDVSPEDVGNYTCQATNRFGTDSLTAELVLTVPDQMRPPIFDNAEAPKIQPFFFPKNHPVGKDVTVSCFASEGQPPLSFSWLKDEVKIASGSKFAVRHPLDKMSTLTIHEVAAADIGNYTCEAKNDGGSDRTTASLVITDAPRLQPFVFPRESVLGETLLVTCVANRGTQPMHFTWLKDWRRSEPGKQGNAEDVDRICIGAEHPQRWHYGLSVKVSSYAFGTLHPVALPVRGSSVTFQLRSLTFQNHDHCAEPHTCGDCEHPSVGDRLLTGSHSTFVNFNMRIFVHFIALLTGASLETITAIQTLDPPKIQPFSFPSDEQLGKDVAVSCFAMRGHQPLRFSWLKNGVRADGSSNADVEEIGGKISTLTIRKLSAADFGNYTCHVSNAAGTDAYTTTLLVNVEPPKIQPFIFPTSKAMPKKVVVHCVVIEGSEPFKFSWLRDGAKLPSAGSSVQVKQVSEAVSSLTISKAGAEDIGNYTCVATNAAGSDSATSQLLVTDIPKLVPFSFPKEQQIGAAVAVTCIASRGTQPLLLTWLKNGLPINPRGNAAPKMLSASISALTIDRVDADDVANYTCRATNAAGSDSHTAELVVAEPPKLQPLALPRNPAPNKKLVLSCVAVEGDPPLEFAWTKDGVPEREGRRRYSTAVLASHISSLTILELTAQDVGNYTCRVSNSAGADSSTASLVVQDTPKIQAFNFPREQQLVGKKVVVSCVAVEGDEPMSFAWFKNGQPLAESAGLGTKVAKLTENMASLTIPDVTAADIGNYTCVVSNKAGEDSFTASLLVNGETTRHESRRTARFTHECGAIARNKASP
ncbi:hypothetical protein HPB49_024198 [Dermacentor silvarum]|uniref:Uncharacterized protein n=1 Tax=Dermacentor silvarum TaxID=543639 RepID=A0ACB8DS03_DERSI|nr:hypothetical protein HPB49_024198 [Dermacentor silvarum]